MWLAVGFMTTKKRQAAPALSRQEIAMLERIKTISEKTHHSYGSRRLAKHLQDEGYDVVRFKVRRLMKQAGVSVRVRVVVVPRPRIVAMVMG